MKTIPYAKVGEIHNGVHPLLILRVETLEGEPLEGVVEADAENGFYVQVKKEENNNFIIKDDEFVTEKIHQEIRIVGSDD